MWGLCFVRIFFFIIWSTLKKNFMWVNLSILIQFEGGWLKKLELWSVNSLPFWNWREQIGANKVFILRLIFFGGGVKFKKNGLSLFSPRFDWIGEQLFFWNLLWGFDFFGGRGVGLKSWSTTHVNKLEKIYFFGFFFL